MSALNRSDETGQPAENVLCHLLKTACSAFRLSSISGQVLDRAGKGVQGARVMAADLRNQYWVFGPAVTDSKGNYLLSWIPAGIYNVRIINLSGYRPTSELVVLAGVPTKGIDFVEEANMTAKIEGKVTDDKGNDLPDATVEAVPDRGGTSSGTTDQFGKYTIDKLWAGKYTVRVVGPASDKYFPVRVEDLKDNEIKTVDFSPLGKIIGRVTDENGNALSPATVEAKGAGATHSSITNSDGTYIIEPLPPGIYTVSVVGPPARADKYLPAHGVDVSAGRETKGIDFSLDIVKDFLGRLDDARFSIEATISIEEANQAVALFSVVTLMLAGLSRRRVANTEKIDMLGVLNLYYGLQEDSLRDRLTFGNPTRLWQDLEKDLKALAKDLDQLQSDLDFLNREAKRQFNLGLSNDVLGNVQFPVHFKRYVEIGSDPLLSFDLEEADKPGSFVDKTKIAQADDLLRELKSLILQVVRSLSKYGTVATKRANEDWAAFEARALEVLQRVTDERVTPDQDLKNIWSVLADLIGKNRETEVAPYVVLARHGGKLLKYAMDIYQEEFSKGKLDDFSSAHLRELFQNKKVPKDFWTEQIRSQATLTKRYPLPNWG